MKSTKSQPVKKTPAKKAAKPSAPKVPKAPKEVIIDPAKLASPSQQRWKKRNGYCLVKGCRNKADKGNFCSGHASARSRLKAKGETLEEPVDFTPKPRGPKPKDGAKPTPAKKPTEGKKAPAKKTPSKKAKGAKPSPEPIEGVTVAPVEPVGAPATPEVALEEASLL